LAAILHCAEPITLIGETVLNEILSAQYYATEHNFNGETVYNMFKTLDEAKQFADKLGGREHFYGQVLGINIPILMQTAKVILPHDRF
jgi:hypothetical protein